MKFAINSAYVRKMLKGNGNLDDLQAALICKNAGFDIIDCTPAFNTDNDYESKAFELAQGLAENGIIVEQSHAPFNRYSELPREEFDIMLWNSFKTAKILGAKYMVIHADEFPRKYAFDSKKASDYAYEMFAPFVEYTAKHGFGVAVENLFDEGARNRFTADINEQIEIIDRFNDKCVTACWDFGHANVQHGENALDKLKLLGSRLSCTHVHDNLGLDSHMQIYDGNIDWASNAEYLKNNYSGIFTYEFVYGEKSDREMTEFLKNAHNTASQLFE